MEDVKKYIDIPLALRYMGCRGAAPDSVVALVKECAAELCDVMRPRYIFREIPISDSGELLPGGDILEHIKGCTSVLFFASTLGSDVDALIRRRESSDVSKAYAIDALASAATERFCDCAEDEIAEKYNGRYLTSRFSPGYGDYPLGVQKDLLGVVDAGRKIGLFATDSFMLSPSKSVTAVMGVSDAPLPRKKSSCSNCNMRDNCSFRKEGDRCGY